MPTESEMRSRRDSWPPTQMRLKPTLSTKNRPLPSLDDIDDDPLTYFLTPAPLLDGDDMDDVLLDFDAGIEDASSPRPFVRSVSPSTLDGLRKPGLRPMSPGTSSEISESNNEDDYDDDDEDYVSFSPSKHGGLLSLRDLFANSRPPVRPKSPAFNQSTNNSLLSPTALSSSPKLRGRSRGRGRHGASSRGHSATRRPGQLWREPSPDVWSIEEETEEEMMSEVGSSVGAQSDTSDDEAESKRRKGKKAKSNKKVRFVLPAQEV
ncbi:hypothetical protein J7337_010588 [Fusarium musae]|uniref:Uncharacterized protein n=1 Tax=Fusarium musae TaxID=1042133 RepID=A0A9P8D987_9HYPO|nr:hypothetical protein J7337_010588 [Fusarium musae]KAG9497717.1 hypothetical protein J7337_010588 [Fusarium musae]